MRYWCTPFNCTHVHQRSCLSQHTTHLERNAATPTAPVAAAAGAAMKHESQGHNIKTAPGLTPSCHLSTRKVLKTSEGIIWSLRSLGSVPWALIKFRAPPPDKHEMPSRLSDALWAAAAECLVGCNGAGEGRNTDFDRARLFLEPSRCFVRLYRGAVGYYAAIPNPACCRTCSPGFQGAAAPCGVRGKAPCTITNVFE